jgi:hypothetical protein
VFRSSPEKRLRQDKEAELLRRGKNVVSVELPSPIHRFDLNALAPPGFEALVEPESPTRAYTRFSPYSVWAALWRI